MHRVASLALLAFAGCRHSADTSAVVSVAEQAARRLASAGEPAVWSVRVVGDSVHDPVAVADSLRARLHVRPRVDRDSLSHEIMLLAAHATGTDLTLHLVVATLERCGPTWADTFGYSERALVHARRSDGSWQIDSIRPLIYGDPGVCTSAIPRLPPNEG